MSALADKVTAAIVAVNEARVVALEEPHSGRRGLVLAALGRSEASLADALASTTDHAASPKLLELQRAERAGDRDEVDRLLGEIAEDSRARAGLATRRVLRGPGFRVWPGRKEAP